MRPVWFYPIIYLPFIYYRANIIKVWTLEFGKLLKLAQVCYFLTKYISNKHFLGRKIELFFIILIAEKIYFVEQILKYSPTEIMYTWRWYTTTWNCLNFLAANLWLVVKFETLISGRGVTIFLGAKLLYELVCPSPSHILSHPRQNGYIRLPFSVLLKTQKYRFAKDFMFH